MLNRISAGRSRAALIAAVLATAAGVAIPAGAAQRAKSEVEIEKLKGRGASGTVSSRAGACEAGRKVKLILIDDYVALKVGKDTTSSSGKWKIDADLDPGRYYAKVSKAKDDDLTCKADESKAKRLR